MYGNDSLSLYFVYLNMQQLSRRIYNVFQITLHNNKYKKVISEIKFWWRHGELKSPKNIPTGWFKVK